MDFLDKVFDAAKGIGQSVAETAGELYDKGKVKVSIAAAQSDLRDVFCEYGEYMYKAEKAGVEPDPAAKADFSAKADALIRRIEEIKATEAEEDNAPQETGEKCAVCGAPRTVADVERCNACGAKFE